MARAASVTGYPVLNALIFAALGVVAFAVAFSIVVKLFPFDLWKEIVEERNTAAAIMAGAVALGLGWIIAATMH
jgi:putative membrane protein